MMLIQMIGFFSRLLLIWYLLRIINLDVENIQRYIGIPSEFWKDLFIIFLWSEIYKNIIIFF